MYRTRLNEAPYPRTTKHALLATLLAGLLALAGCASPEPDEGPRGAGLVAKAGLVLLMESSAGGLTQVSAQASFESLTPALAKGFLDEPFGEQLGSCTVDTTGAPANGLVVPTPRGNSLSAGDRLTLEVDGAEFASLRREEGGYRMPAVITELPAAGLVLNVPSTPNFPGPGRVEVVTGARLAFTDGFDGSAVEPGTVFTWQPEAAESAVLLIGRGGGVGFACLAPDAGTFRFPAETVAALEAAGFAAGSLLGAGRLSMGTHVVEDRALMVGVLRLVDLPVAGAGR